MTSGAFWDHVYSREGQIWRAGDTAIVREYFSKSTGEIALLADEINSEREALRRAIGAVAGEFNIEPTRKPPGQAGEPDERKVGAA